MIFAKYSLNGFLLSAVMGVVIGNSVNSPKSFRDLNSKVPKFIHPTGEVLAERPNVAASTYSSTGWVAMVYFYMYDTTCSGDPYYTTGIPAATCLPYGGGSYMYQLTQDSCDGGIAQYFSDENCVTYSHSQALPTGACEPFGEQSYYYACTTSSQPLVETESVIETFYSSYTCTGALSYSAFAMSMCMEEDDDSGNQIGMCHFACNGDAPELVSYPSTDTDCSGTSTGTSPYPTGCMEYTYNDENSFKFTCSTSGGGGGSGGGSSTLSPAAAAGVSIAVIAVVGIAAGLAYFLFFAKTTALAGAAVTIQTTAQPMASPATAL